MTRGAPKAPLGLTIPLKELYKRWKKFKKKYRTKEECVDGIISLGDFDTKNCRECGGTDVTRTAGSSKVKCLKCFETVDLFKGTFFEGMRKEFAYFAAFWFVKQNIGISENFFAELVGIAQSTAFEIFKKYDTVILETLMGEASNADSDLFAEVFVKRSSETPARVKPSKERSARSKAESRDSGAKETSEVVPGTENAMPENSSEDGRSEAPNTEVDDDLPDELFQFAGTSFPISKQRKVYRAMTDEPISIDALCVSTGFESGEVGGILTWMQLSGLIQPLGGSYYKRTGKVGGIDKLFPIDKKQLQQFFDYIHYVFHGISRKHLQKFLARFWAFICDRFHDTDFLLKACAKHPPINRASIRMFVTPDVVKVMFN